MPCSRMNTSPSDSSFSESSFTRSALARVSRLLRDKAMCAKLRGADNPDALFALLIEPLASHTAA